MQGENFKRIDRGSDAKTIKEEILLLENECGKLYKECKETGIFNSTKHDDLVKEIEWKKYILWGIENGMIIK